MKRRSLTLVVCLLATLSLASVGFAAWVISAGDTEQLTGSITVETVTDERYVIKDLSVEGVVLVDASGEKTENVAPNFVFGKTDPDKGGGYIAPANPWLKNSTIEKLSLVVKFKVYQKAAGVDNADLEITNKDKITITNTFESLSDLGTYASIVAANPEANYVDSYFTFTISLQWGSEWGGENPFDYYNGEAMTDALALEAKTKLTDMYSDLNGATYRLTVDVQPKAA